MFPSCSASFSSQAIVLYLAMRVSACLSMFNTMMPRSFSFAGDGPQPLPPLPALSLAARTVFSSAVMAPKFPFRTGDRWHCARTCPMRASLSCRGREDLVHHVKDDGLTLCRRMCKCLALMASTLLIPALDMQTQLTSVFWSIFVVVNFSMMGVTLFKRESTNTADRVAQAESHQRLCSHLNVENTRRKNVHMCNDWMLPDPKFNIRSTAVSIEDRDSKPQCRIHCDHLLMSSVLMGWFATFQTPADSMNNRVHSRMFPKGANSLAPDGQTSLTPWSKWNTSKQLCHPVKVLTSRLNLLAPLGDCLVMAGRMPLTSPLFFVPTHH